MFAPRWFAPRYWAARFFASFGAQAVRLPAPVWRCYTPAEETRTYTARGEA